AAIVGGAHTEEIGDRRRAARDQVDEPIAGEEEPLLERGDRQGARLRDERIRWCSYRFHRGDPAVSRETGSFASPPRDGFAFGTGLVSADREGGTTRF